MLPKEVASKYSDKTITKQDWASLPSSSKEFYARLAALDYLNSDFEQTQKFFDDRISKIKSDSQPYFNEYTVRLAVREYADSNPVRVINDQPQYEQITGDLFDFIE